MTIDYVAGALAIIAGISSVGLGWCGRLKVWWLSSDLPDRIYVDRLVSLCVGVLLICVGALIIAKSG